jgi:pyrroline-5-carboxylate reductase
MKIGFIGSGKMATALVQGAVSSRAFAPEDIVVCDAVAGVADKLAASVKARAAATNEELAREVEALVLCVKPVDALEALRALRPHLAGRLVVSIVAGLPLAALQEAAGAEARVVRVMPNTPALIQRGAAAYSLGRTAAADDAALTEKLFGAVGQIVRVKEELLDVVTGLSGSGPAYVYLVIEALADAGVLMGLARDLSLKLAAQTVVGAAQMVIETGRHPAALRDEVTSPGGTTAAGLAVLEAAAVRSAFLQAVRAATERARELGASK